MISTLTQDQENINDNEKEVGYTKIGILDEISEIENNSIIHRIYLIIIILGMLIALTYFTVSSRSFQIVRASLLK